MHFLQSLIYGCLLTCTYNPLKKINTYIYIYASSEVIKDHRIHFGEKTKSNKQAIDSSKKKEHVHGLLVSNQGVAPYSGTIRQRMRPMTCQVSIDVLQITELKLVLARSFTSMVSNIWTVIQVGN